MGAGAGRARSGKTTLARAILRAAAGDPDLIVPSPTFTLVELYRDAAGHFWHSIFSLEAPSGLRAGWDDALAEGIVLIDGRSGSASCCPASQRDPGNGGAGRRALLAV